MMVGDDITARVENHARARTVAPFGLGQVRQMFAECLFQLASCILFYRYFDQALYLQADDSRSCLADSIRKTAWQPS